MVDPGPGLVDPDPGPGLLIPMIYPKESVTYDTFKLLF